MRCLQRPLLYMAGLLLLLGGCGVLGPGATPTNASLTLTPASPTTEPSVTRSAIPTPTPGLLPPSLVDAWPRAGEEVPTDAVLMWSFDQPMDRQSVESSLRLLPEASGTFAWTSDRDVLFTPESLLPGQRYIVSLAGEVRSATGLPLSGVLEYAFGTVSPLQVTHTTPSDNARDIWSDAPILIEFNRPVVPTNCVGRAADGEDGCLALPLTLSPPVIGSGIWIDTSTYRYESDSGLRAGQGYVVSLALPVASTDGASLLTPYTWGFETAVPRVLTVDPDPGAYGVLIDAGIRVRFSTPMDHFYTAGAFSLVGSNGQPMSGSVTWQDGGTTLVFTPTQRLELDTSYAATIGPSARASTSTPLEQPYSWAFSTVSYPQLLTHTPAAGARDVDVSEPVQLTFSGRIDPEELAARIGVSPEPPEGALYTWYDAAANILTLSWPREPRTESCVTVDPDLTDVYGNRLQNAEGFCFETGDLSPGLELVQPLNAVTLSADRPASLQLLNLNVTSARFSLMRIDLSQFAATGAASGEIAREWTVSFEQELNVTQTVTISLDRLGGPLPTGLYALTWQPAGQDEPSHILRLAVVDRHVLVKLADEEALVWVTQIGSGEPVTRTAVQLLDRESLLLAGGTTDGDGLVALPVAERGNLWEPVAAVVGEPGMAGFGIALTGWQGSLSPADFGVEFNANASQTYQAYLQVDRPIYLNGDTVHYAGVLRRYLAGRYDLPPHGTAAVLTVLDPSGDPVYTTTALVSASGLFSGSLMLPVDSLSGDYNIQVASDAADEGSVAIPLPSARFTVAACRDPAFQVLVTPETSAAALGGTVSFTIEAEYVSGGAVGRAATEWTLSAQSYNPDAAGQFETWTAAGWSWGTGSEPGEWAVIDRGSGETDLNGRYVLELPSDVTSRAALPDGSQVWLLEAVVTDDTGTSVAGIARTVLHQADYYMALRPEAGFVRAGELATVHIAVADWMGVGASDVDVRLTLFHRTLSELPADASRPYADTIVVEELVPTDAHGLGTVNFRLTDSGAYIVVATAVDSAGRSATAELALWAGAGDSAIYPRFGPAGLDLVADAEVYTVGDEAAILVPVQMDSPYRLLVTVEREGILWTQTYVFDRPNPVIEIPITAEYAPVVYVFCAVIAPGTETTPAQAQVGYTTLTVETAEQRLHVDVLADQIAYEPGTPARLTISVTDADGQPQAAEITVALTGASVLASKSTTQPAIAEVFYGQRPLRVVTGGDLLVATDRVAAIGNGSGVSGERSGSTGGSAAGAAGIDLYPSEDFPDTAYFGSAIMTDAQGSAELTVDLPDAQTSWEVHVWAVTPDTKVGETTELLSVSKSLSIQPITPQFLVAGDRAELAALVRNGTDHPLTVDVQLQTGDALRLESVAIRRLVVAPGRRERVAWTVTAAPEGGEPAEVLFSARSGQYSDTSSPVLLAPVGGLLPIRVLESRDVTGGSGSLDDAGSRIEAVTLPANAGAGSEVVLRVDTSITSIVSGALGRGMPDSADSTDAWVNELTTVAAAHTVLAEAGWISVDLSAVEASAAGVLDQVYVRQNPDGGWGWHDEASDLHLTTYVVYGLMGAQRAGLAVRESVLSSGLSYIRDQVVRGAGDGLRRPSYAFAVSVLAVAEQALPQGTGAALYADRDQMGIAGRAYLALAFGALDSSDTRLGSLLEELRASVILSASGAHWEHLDQQSWTTGVQSTALVLKVLARYAPDDALLPQVVRWLATARGATPYETAWVLSALSDYVVIGGDLEPAYAWRLALNGDAVAEAAATDLLGRTLVLRPADTGTVGLRDGLNVIEIARDAGPGYLYYTVQRNTSLPVSLDAQGDRRGMSLSRQYCAVEGYAAPAALPEAGQCKPVETLEVGDLVEVQLTLVLPKSRHYVRIEDPFPAGFEPASPAVATAVAVGDGAVSSGTEADPGSRDGGALGWPDFRHDRALYFVEQLTPGTYRVSYRLRAAIPGRFHALPAVAEEVYFPEVWASTAVDVLEIAGR